MPSTSRVLLLAAATTAGVLGALPVAAAPAAPQRPQTVALVDLQRCPCWRPRKAPRAKDLESVLRGGQSQLDKKTEDLKKKYEDLMAKRAMLSDGEIAKRQQELVVGDQELQQLHAQLQEDVATKEAQLTEKIYKNVAAIVKDIAGRGESSDRRRAASATVLYANRQARHYQPRDRRLRQEAQVTHLKDRPPCSPPSAFLAVFPPPPSRGRLRIGAVLALGERRRPPAQATIPQVRGVAVVDMQKVLGATK